MPFCKNCGRKLEADAKFCPTCGAPAIDAEMTHDDTTFKTVKRDAGPYGAYRLEDLPEGFVIDDRYEVKAKIGQGGFGAVYRAFDRSLSVDKAIKIIPDGIAADREAMSALRKETRTLVSLTHDAIVRVYDVHDTGSIKYIDMEYVNGRPLNELKIDGQGGVLPEEEVRPLGLKIAEALSYAHGKGVIHKDVKPQNVMVMDKGNVKIMDFGISESLRTSMSRLANSSSSGTLVYMSPEQVRGEDVGPEADIYSFGAMLYELLSGHPPFWKGDIHYQIFNELPKEIDGISDEMNDLVLKCLEKDYQDRFSSFNEVLDAVNGNTIFHRYSHNLHNVEQKHDVHFYIDKIFKLSFDKDTLLVDLEGIIDKILKVDLAEQTVKRLEDILDDNPGSAITLAALSLLYRNLGEIEIEYKVLSRMISNEEKGVSIPNVFSFLKMRKIDIENMKNRYSKLEKDRGEDFLLLLIEAEKAELLDHKVINNGRKEETKKVIEEALSDERWNDALKFLEDGSLQTYLDKTYMYEKKAFAQNMKEKQEKVQKILEKNRGMVLIEGGTFTMGSADDAPPHKVTVSSFFISDHEVTQDLYTEIIGRNPSDRKAGIGNKKPVTCVNWYEAVEFCNKLSREDGFEELYTYEDDSIICDFSKQGYRLPTEAEWEYTAKSNQKAIVYTTGIMEWCWDWFETYTSDEKNNPIGPDVGLYKVIRRKKKSDFPGRIEFNKRYTIWPDNNGNKELSFRIVCRI